MENIKVSVCVPIYGVEKYINRCLKSLFGQTYSNIEYVFVNDCTPDRSMEILHQCIKEYPTREKDVRIISHNKNRGLSAVRNTAIECCTGDFLMWVDPDDYIELDAIRLAVEKQIEENSDIVSFNAKVYYQNYQELWKHPSYSTPKDMARMIIARCAPVIVWGRLIRTSLYKTHHIQAEEGVNMSEDYQVIPVLAFYAEKVSVLDKVLYHYDRTNEQAYTYKISIDKMEQTWTSFVIVKSFFAEKGMFFTNAINRAEIIIVYNSLVSCSKDKANDGYFKNVLQKRLAATDNKQWGVLPSVQRVVLYLHDVRLIRQYVRFGNWIKHFALMRYNKNMEKNNKQHKCKTHYGYF